MKFQKLLIKIAYWLVAISILVIIGLTILSNRLIKKQLNTPATETASKSESINDQVLGEDGVNNNDSDKITDPESIEKTYSGDFFQTD